jgi:glycosyltransferase involved in cell wall biosynthesis
MERSLGRLIRYLKEDSLHVSVLLTEEKGEWFDLFNEEYCNVTYIPFNRGGAAFHLWKIRKYIINSKCNLLLLFSDKYSQTIIPLLPDTIKVIPVIRLDDPYFYKLAATNNDFVDGYIVNSLKLHDTLKVLVPFHPIQLINNGFPVPHGKVIAERAKFGIPLKLLFVGRLTEQKNVTILPEIIYRCLKLNLNVILNVVGEGELEDEVVSQIQQYKLEKYINLTGFVPKNEIDNWYLQSHILLFPTLCEGLPNVLLEAQGCGCVPIANLLPKITDIVIKENETGIIVTNNNLEQFVGAIEQLYRDKIVWQKLSSNGIQWVVQNFSTQQEKINYLSFFLEIMKKTRRVKRNFLSVITHSSFRLINLRDWVPPGMKRIKHLFRS